ncbi:hypothetical protein L6164_002186 [Bauhinia variegata]|uniref:Uncharacterized protein n=1 Tax=Bauhinia variegata TaxID=167791 RepID=A0ACB9PXY2_BAUVA|nr:hypothetical protein L6164_002186 [Bauhinia variegata]
MTSLELCGSNLTILPECIQACQHLSDLNLDNCKQLQEIRAIPPKIKVLSARNCTSLNPSALDLLLDKNIHSRGNTCFTLPGTRILKWFDCYATGKESLYFSFLNEFPDIALFSVGASNEMFDSLLIECRVSVNGDVVDEWHSDYPELESRHTFIYDLRCRRKLDILRKVFPKDIWYRAEISYVFKSYHLGARKEPLVEQKGFHIYDRARIVRDVLFPNAYHMLALKRKQEFLKAVSAYKKLRHHMLSLKRKREFLKAASAYKKLKSSLP